MFGPIERGLLVFALGLGACRSGTDATDSAGQASPAPSPTQPSQLRITALPFLLDCPRPGQILDGGPTVLVTDFNGVPKGGVGVSFSATIRGQIERNNSLTDANGRATAGSWRLADDAGANVVVASIAGGPSTMFSVTTKMPTHVVASYDLATIAGQSLPITYPNAGTITGAHYVLADDSTYTFGYERNGQADQVVPLATALCSHARFVVSSTAIDFYLAPGTYPLSTFYQERNGHFAIATPSARTMSVKYDDFVDFDDETYVLHDGFEPIALASYRVAAAMVNVRAPASHDRIRVSQRGRR
jgi:hypothetical protein